MNGGQSVLQELSGQDPNPRIQFNDRRGDRSCRQVSHDNGGPFRAGHVQVVAGHLATQQVRWKAFYRVLACKKSCGTLSLPCAAREITPYRRKTSLSPAAECLTERRGCTVPVCPASTSHELVRCELARNCKLLAETSALFLVRFSNINRGKILFTSKNYTYTDGPLRMKKRPLPRGFTVSRQFPIAISLAVAFLYRSNAVHDLFVNYVFPIKSCWHVTYIIYQSPALWCERERNE